MNVFNLFESDDFNSIKLGIEVVKSLGYQNEFKKEIGISFDRYENLYKQLVEYWSENTVIFSKSQLIIIFKTSITQHINSKNIHKKIINNEPI